MRLRAARVASETAIRSHTLRANNQAMTAMIMIHKTYTS